MPTAGKTVLIGSGKRGVRTTGRSSVFNAAGLCQECCGEPEPQVLDSFLLTPGARIWDLSSWQGVGVISPFLEESWWRVIETVSNCYPQGLGWGFFSGFVEQVDGELENLPSQLDLTGLFPNSGTLELQIGATLDGFSTITWPGTCHTPTPVATFQEQLIWP